MNSNTFIDGLSRVLNCSKVHVAVTGLVTTWFAVRYAAADLPPTERAAMWVAFIGAVAIQLREIINAWTEEDVANAVHGKQSDDAGDAGTPRQGGNADRSLASGLPVSPSPRPSVSPSPVLPSASPDPAGLIKTESLTYTRSPDMPSRTMLPLVLVGFSLVALFGAAGCQSPAELTVYREGLHQVDEPLYQAHLLLMDDAVKAAIRADSDRQVVQQGIAAARALYQQSAATAAAGTTTAAPATAPSVQP